MTGRGGPSRTAESVLRFVDDWDEVPALLLDRHLDVLGASRLALAIVQDLEVGANLARLGVAAAATMGADDAARTCSDVAALLRDALAASAEDDRFVALVGELVATSRGFATAWAESRGGRRSGRVRLPHPAVGVLRLDYLRVPVDGAGGAVLLLARSDDSATVDRLRRLSRPVG